MGINILSTEQITTIKKEQKELASAEQIMMTHEQQI
jgi:hypothetical protein